MAEARILYIATANGLRQLANPGRSDRWREIGRALDGQDVRAVAASPLDPLVVLAGTNTGIFRSSSGGASWEQVLSEPARMLVSDPSGTVFTLTQRGTVLRSTNGELWEEIQLAPMLIEGLIAPQADRVVAFDKRAVYQWTPREHGVQVEFAPEIRLVGMTTVANAATPVVFVLVEDASGKQAAFPAPPTGALVMLGGKKQVLLVGTEGPLLRGEGYDETQPDVTQLNPQALTVLMFGTDDELPFMPVSGPTQVTALVTPPRYFDQAFAGTADGALWFSADRGRTWIELRTGYSPIRDIAFARAL
jgi:hypothetical protein